MDYKIKFTTEASGDGAKKTAEELRQIRDTAKQVNAEMTAASSAVNKSAASSAAAMREMWGESSKTREEMRGAAGVAANELGPTVAKAGDAAQTAAYKKRDLVAVLKVLRHEIPGLSTALTLLKNPYAGIVAGVAAFVLAIKKQIDAQNEITRAAQVTIASLDALNTTIKTGAEEHTKAAEAANAHALALAAIDSAASETEANLDRETKTLKKKAELEKEEAHAQAALEKAQIDVQKAGGKLSEPQAAAAKSIIDARVKKEDAARNRKLTADVDAASLNAADEMQQDFLNAEEALPGAEKAMVDAKAAAAQAALNRDLKLKALDERNKELNKRKAEIQSNNIYQFGAPWWHPSANVDQRKMQEEMTAIDAELGGQPAQASAARNTAERAAAFAGRVEKGYTRLTAFSESARGKASKTYQTYDQSRTEAGLEAQSEARLGPIRSQTDSANTLAAALEDNEKEREKAHKAFMDFVKRDSARVRELHGAIEQSARNER